MGASATAQGQRAATIGTPAAYVALLEASTAAASSLDRDLRCTAFNRKHAADMELLYANLPLRRGLPPAHAAIVRELVVPIVNEGTSVSAIVGAARCEASVGPRTSPVLHDLTEHRKLQARIARSDRLASMGMLAAGVAHDLLLLDVMMAHLSGTGLQRWLVGVDAVLGARVVFLTGGVFTAEARAALEASGCRRIERPFDPALLDELLAELPARGGPA